MLAAFAVLQVLAQPAAAPIEVDRICRKALAPDPVTGRTEDVCEILAVDHGDVVYVEPGIRRMVIGQYVSAARSFVPAPEAPIRDVRSPSGWHVVVSSFLDCKEVSAELRVRLFRPDGTLGGVSDILTVLEGIEVGYLFGDGDDVLAIQSSEEHSYNSRTDVWLLPNRGEPQRLLDINATLGRFSGAVKGARPGVWVNRQTYDGVHASTKGWVGEFWVWNHQRKSLTLEKQ